MFIGGLSAGVLSRAQSPAFRADFTIGTLPSWVGFSRPSTATFYDSAGVMRTASVNAPRFDHDPATQAAKGLLVEEQRTNLVTHSGDFTNGAWNKINLNAPTSSTRAPDGVSFATQLMNVLGSGSEFARIVQSYNTTIGPTIAASAFMAAGSDSYSMFDGWDSQDNIAIFDLATGAVVSVTAGSMATIQPVSNGFFRGTLLRIVNASFNVLTIGPASSGNRQSYAGDHILGWGAQVEQGAYPTSYIPTTGAAVTRAPDMVSLSGAAATAAAAGPVIVEYMDQATGVTQRASLAAGAFSFATGRWYRQLAIYPPATTLASLLPKLNPGTAL